jgi:hypothetical protein
MWRRRRDWRFLFIACRTRNWVTLDVFFYRDVTMAETSHCGVRAAQCAITVTEAGKVFTDTQIRHAPDCAGIRCGRISFFMTLSPPVPLPDVEKLRSLQQLDQFREWRSLDDRRYCLVCGKIITGRQIQVERGTSGNGLLRLSCPTERCNSIPMDWALPTDEILALTKTATPQESNVVPSEAPGNGVEDGLASRLRTFVVNFKRVSNA